MATNFTIDQELIDTLFAHLQAKGYEAQIRKVFGVEMIEVKRDSQILHWDMLLFDSASKEDALQLADSLLDKKVEQVK